MNEISIRFVETVYRICRERGIGIFDLEDKVGVNRSYFSRNRREGRSMSLELAMRISNELGMTIEEMIS